MNTSCMIDDQDGFTSFLAIGVMTCVGVLGVILNGIVIAGVRSLKHFLILYNLSISLIICLLVDHNQLLFEMYLTLPYVIIVAQVKSLILQIS